jgi:hypothetical protein
MIVSINTNILIVIIIISSLLSVYTCLNIYIMLIRMSLLLSSLLLSLSLISS